MCSKAMIVVSESYCEKATGECCYQSELKTLSKQHTFDRYSFHESGRINGINPGNRISGGPAWGGLNFPGGITWRIYAKCVLARCVLAGCVLRDVCAALCAIAIREFLCVQVRYGNFCVCHRSPVSLAVCVPARCVLARRVWVPTLARCVCVCVYVFVC